MPRLCLPVEDRLHPFSISSYTYKVVDGHEIKTDVLIPKKLLELGPDSDDWIKPRPIMIRFHGGWLAGGGRGEPFSMYTPLWLYSSAYHNNAIIVSADYRLLPEASAIDVLVDIDDFWKWLGSDLPRIVREQSKAATGADRGLEADLDRIVVQGESAGGYCAVQCALSHSKPATVSDSGPTEPRIRALVAIYPMLDLRSPHWTKPHEKDGPLVFGHPPYPESVIDEHLKELQNNFNSASKPVLSSAPLGPGTPRDALPIAYIQHGRFLEFLGPDRDPSPGKRRVHPEDRIADGAKLPPTLFVHAIEDSGVPVAGTDRFIDLIRRYDAIARPEEESEGGGDWEPFMYARVPGEHGFDGCLGPEAAAWTKEGLDYVEKIWLGSG